MGFSMAKFYHLATKKKGCNFYKGCFWEKSCKVTICQRKKVEIALLRLCPCISLIYSGFSKIYIFKSLDYNQIWQVHLWIIPNPPTSKIWKRKPWIQDISMSWKLWMGFKCVSPFSSIKSQIVIMWIIVVDGWCFY